jgi:hypothetical protein
LGRVAVAAERMMAADARGSNRWSWFDPGKSSKAPRGLGVARSCNYHSPPRARLDRKSLKLDSGETP